MRPNEEVPSHPAPRPACLETRLLQVRHIFRVFMLLNQRLDLDEDDGEALATLADIGHDLARSIEAEMFPTA